MNVEVFMKYSVNKFYEIEKEKWKFKNEEYVLEIAKFFDKASQIKDQELQESIIVQMLKCDRLLTELSEKMFQECYMHGSRKARRIKGYTFFK